MTIGSPGRGEFLSRKPIGSRSDVAISSDPNQPKLILASQSPRRLELLTQLGVPFQLASADIDETPRPGEPPDALVQRLAREKAMAVQRLFPRHPVLAADTVVVLDGRILGKPIDEQEALLMLRDLRGRDHLVLSAVFAATGSTGRQAAELSRSLVWMRPYSEKEIISYIASGDPMDKAGAYAIQNRDFAPVERIDGCFSGVMGFPLAHVVRALRSIGITPPGDVVTACAPYAGFCCDA
ncbi:MAG: Maf family protein [Chloroflexota bacterium]|nr:Maf family protein [Chloroflexota bacterium]